MQSEVSPGLKSPSEGLEVWPRVKPSPSLVDLILLILPARQKPNQNLRKHSKGSGKQKPGESVISLNVQERPKCNL